MAAAQRAVARGRVESLSAWVNEAFRLKVERTRASARWKFIAEYEASDGVITEAEMRAASRRADARITNQAQTGCASRNSNRVTLILDAGALIAVERSDRDVGAL